MTELPLNKCKRCGHTWIPRQKVVAQCPACKSYNWNTDPKKQERANNKRQKKNHSK